ncbi:MAG TPA: glycosyltransferase family A protein [Bryobacteraceae bacterium]|nr:glycosyltransferase family A protein [Bryobacteraceae bacterium]
MSAIIPAYNAAGYIREALDSIFAQSFPDFEAIVVNDGSPDGGALESVLASYSDTRLRYLRKTNGGLSSARNAGIAAARGKWVAFLDADDIWLPNYLNSQLVLLGREPDAAAAFPDGFIFGDTPLSGKRLSAIPGHQLGPVTLTDVVMGRSNLNYCCTVKRASIERIGGFDESLKRTEDHDLYLRLLLAGERILVNPEPLFRYRRRNDSLSADGVAMARAALEVFEKLDSQFARHPGLSRLVQDRRNGFRADIEFALAREALLQMRWRAAREHWRAYQRLRPSWKVAAALGISRISPRSALALMKLNDRFRRAALR